MLHSLKHLIGYQLDSAAGNIGEIRDFIIHPDWWSTRYMIVSLDDGARSILLTPGGIEAINRQEEQAMLNFSPEMLANSPTYNPSEPVSRSLETQVHDYFKWPYYWEDEKTIPTTGPGDLTGVPLAEMEIDTEQQQEQMAEESSDTNAGSGLRRFQEVVGFSLQTRDGNELGQLDDLIVNDENWAIMYAIVDLGGLLPGKKVLVSPSLITYFDWERQEFEIDLTQETVQQSPEFDYDMLQDSSFHRDS
jgi:hypothetical protein